MPAKIAEVRALADEHPDWIEFGDGVIVYQTIIEKVYPHLDIGRLCSLFDDNRGDWSRIVKEYESKMKLGGRHEQKRRRRPGVSRNEATAPKPTSRSRTGSRGRWRMV